MTDIGQMEWMRALRDDPNVIGGRLLVLVMLASRMRDDGTGWALHWQLVADAGVNERTVERALEWALDAGYLQRLGRGHRVLDDADASGYRLTLPTPPAS